MSSKSTEPRDSRVQHLLQVVEENRDKRCNAMLDEAKENARDIVRQARRKARRHMHESVMAIRDSARQQLASAEASRKTHLRLQRHKADKQLLERAWQPLVDSLLQRWQAPEDRQLWINGLLGQASAMLVNRQWHIEHPADWPDNERNALEARLSRELGHSPAFQVHDDIRAGLRICAGSTCVDGTLDGLLESRSRVEARMLAALDTCRREKSGENT